MKCKVCGKRFRPLSKNKYIVTEKIGAFEGLTKAPKMFECFDCTRCGCQNIVNIREGKLEDTKAGDDDESKGISATD